LYESPPSAVGTVGVPARRHVTERFARYLEACQSECQLAGLPLLAFAEPYGVESCSNINSQCNVDATNGDCATKPYLLNECRLSCGTCLPDTNDQFD
jgi:hypothetical protein